MMKLESAIRLVAGIFVLGSLALGFYVNANWYLFTALVGFMLFQSSFTGLCPMEWILKKTAYRK